MHLKHLHPAVAGTWEGWLLIHGGLDYMKHIVGGAEGNSIMALVHWFLDDNAAFCNGIRLLATCLAHLAHLIHLQHARVHPALHLHCGFIDGL